jgi:hypothetical protein
MMNLQVAKTSVHCDNCGNEFETEKKVEEHLNEKCEKCGSVLVTQEDVDIHNQISNFVAKLNALFGDFSEHDLRVGGEIKINTTTKEVNFKPIS